VSAPSAEGCLAELEAGLKALISGLESQPLPGPVVLDSIWLRVQRGFAAVQAHVTDAVGAGALAREPLERCQRLHVLATGLSARRREEVATARKACTQLQARLRAERAADAHGASCDVTG
jgi:hypothetical protein